MNIKYNILPLFAAVTLLTACSDDDIDRVYTVGEADNAIVLKVGVREGSGTQIATRGEVDGNHDATNKTDGSNVYGGGHTPFKAIGTKLALRIDGTWTGKGNVSQQTIATLGAATGTDNKHNSLSGYNPVRYWDDYGTADPGNTAGRNDGLTIYGIGVDGVKTAPNMEADASWTSFTWSVCSDAEANGTATPKEIDQATNGWANYDLLTSNNIQPVADGKDYDGTYKFDDYLSDKNTDNKKSSNILEFTHAMTKITVQLTAGEGFPRTDADDATTAHFEKAPTVTLEGFNYTGSVSVEAKSSTPTTNTTANIKMHLNEGGATHTATFDALVFPGNVFADDKQILTFTADGNTLHVTAAKLNEAIQSAIVNTSTTKYPGNNNTLLQAWNYLLKITVKKTDLDITATILNWNTVVAEEESPKINVDKVYGHEGSAFAQNFDFFRSTNKASGYSKDAWVEHKETSGTHTYTFHDQLYWPNHQTHYFFRGVYPRVQTSSEAGWIPTDKVSSSTSSASTIAVSNVPYEAGKYPSDLALGWPKTEGDADFDETCKVAEHNNAQGICATEGQIRMNFKYMMSQVEVELKTVDSPDAAKVNIGANTVVELVNVYNSGTVNLSDGIVTGTGDKGNYTLNAVSGDGNKLKRHSAIVPQTLTYSTVEAEKINNVRFKITVTNDDAVLYTDSDSEVIAGTKNEGDVKTPATTDIYYADINPILKSDKSDKVAPNGKWESGVHYKYTLTLSKTAINVTATLKDWVTVTASDNVWF